MALTRLNATYPIVARTPRLESAMRTCVLQTHCDKLTAGLDMADKLVTQAQGEAPDPCRQQITVLRAACPTSFASMNADAARRLTALR